MILLTLFNNVNKCLALEFGLNDERVLARNGFRVIESFKNDVAVNGDERNVVVLRVL